MRIAHIKFLPLNKPIFALLSGLAALLAVGCGVTSRSGYLDSGYTLEELREAGVNTQHLFVLSDRQATYNGKRFSIKHPIDSLIRTFGADYRILPGTEHNAGYDHYFWDEIGFVALISPEREVLKWSLHWEYLPRVEEYDYDDPDPALVPAKFFEGKILLNGIPVDNSTDYAAYCENRKVRDQLRAWAAECDIENYRACLYYYDPKTVMRYQHEYHKLYLFDYSEFAEPTFFSYRLKVATQTRCLHEIAMQYDNYINPDTIQIF